jgi:N6-L-threonylcarbamoyladenine synthase
MDKLKLAVQETGTQIAIGGVSANSGIRNTLKETEKNTVGKPLFRNLNIRPIMPLCRYCGVSKVLSQQFETSSVVSKARI